MKRLITLALIFALLLSLLGCQEVKNDSGESSFDKSNNFNKNYVFDYDFHQYLDEMNFDENLSERELRNQVGTYKYEGQSINSMMLGMYEDGFDGGGYSAQDRESRFSYASLATFYDDEGYVIRSDYFRSDVPLEGLDLPSGITFDDDIISALERLKVNIFSVDELLAYQDEAYIVYETENEVFSVKKLTNGEWVLSYTEKYLSKRDNKSEVTRNLSIYYDGESYGFSGFYVSCEEKYYYALGDPDSILKAWTGDFTEEKLKSAIDEYKTNYKNIAFREGAWQVSFGVGFQTSSCVVVRTSIVDENNADFELNEGVLDFYPEVDVNINRIAYLPIYTADELPQNCSVISYLVCAEEYYGEEHYFYFRVDYSKAERNTCVVDVSQLPSWYNYSFIGESANKILDYISSLSTTAVYDEDPNEYGGITWVISVKMDNGETLNVYYLADMFIRTENGVWRKINSDEASRFEDLLNELNK